MSKIFNDPIYGRIKIPDYCVKIIDTIEFQRLRNLKQLGFTNYVFYGATHTRFEHSIGVCYLSGEWVVSLKEKHPELDITTDDIKIVMIASLVHDIGHGPFSHTFERFIKKVRPEINYNHEDMTIKIVRKLNESGKIDTFSNDNIEKVCNIIKGIPLLEKPFLAHIVHNTINGLDSDKLDYFIRDSQCTSFAVGYDWKRIIYESSVKDNEIVFPYKMAGDIFNLYQIRFRLYKELYFHKTVRIIEDMLLEILELADKRHVFNFGSNKHNPVTLSCSVDEVDSFLLTQDDIIGQMERCSYPDIIESINLIKQRQFKKDLKNDSRIAHYGMENKNPLNFVKFITKEGHYIDININLNLTESMCPQKFSIEL